MDIRNDIRHALKVMTTRQKVMVLSINFIGSCFGLGGSLCALLWTVGYVAGKSKEVDYTDPQLVRLVINANDRLNKRTK